VGAALQAGRPLLMLPTQAEQLLQARRVTSCGAGRWLAGAEVEAGFDAALAGLLGDSPMHAAARALAARHPADAAVAERIARRCEALAAGAAPLA
jgi:UDP:flavonoid glycosyltransferase YjiC (YdhE family)